MSLSFFDIKHNWDIFIPYLNHESFIRHLNQYKSWNFNKQYTGPLLYMNNYSFNNPTEDVLYVSDKLDENLSINNPYYFCVPHECVDLNPLVTSSLISSLLKVDLKELYVVNIQPINSYDIHVVISNQKLELREYSMSMELEKNIFSEKILLFDLIYPLCNFVGKSWHDKDKDLDKILVTYCETVTDNIDAMGYFRH